MANENAPSTGELGEDSLNAGLVISDGETPAPTGPVPDPLTTQLEGEPDVVMGALKALNEDAPAVTESIYPELSYLRDDIITARGMTQRLAAEAIAIKPDFGRGKPLNFYSKHPSLTGLQASLEEIDHSARLDLDCQIQAQIIYFKRNAQMVSQDMLDNFNWENRMTRNALLTFNLRELKGALDTAGLVWEDTRFKTAVLNPENAPVPEVLKVPVAMVTDLANMEGYYKVHIEASSILEITTSYLRAWREAFQKHLTALKDTGDSRTTTEIPKAPSVAFYGGQTTSLLNVPDVFRKALEDAKGEAIGDTMTLANNMTAAVQQAYVPDILSRISAYNEEAEQLGAVLEEIRGYLNTYDQYSDNLTFVCDGVYKLVSEFTKIYRSLNDVMTESLKWVFNLSVAVSYTDALVAGVIHQGFAAANTCKDTMQMPEDTYTYLNELVKSTAA